MLKQKNVPILLALVYLSFFALGLPDGALGVAWPIIREQMALPLDQVSIIFISHSIFYGLASGFSGTIAAFLKLEKINFLGLVLMAFGLLGFAMSPSFIMLVSMTVFSGMGMGLVDSSLNAYMAKHFSSRYMNWLHCFWGMGAAVSPFLMTRMIMSHSWRAGYASISIIQWVTALVVLISLLRGIWKMEEKLNEDGQLKTERKPFLALKRFQFMQIFIFFLYAGFEYSMSIWIPSILLESRGMDLEVAGWYPTAYFAGIMAGRMVFGFLAGKFSNVAIIRCGFLMALAGLAIMAFSNLILGMALIGFGFGPVFPCLMHETSSRFSPSILTKLVGYQIAAVGAGVAVISSMIGQLLTHVSLEALFPAVMILVVLAFLLNEIIEKNYKKVL